MTGFDKTQTYIAEPQQQLAPVIGAAHFSDKMRKFANGEAAELNVNIGNLKHTDALLQAALRDPALRTAMVLDLQKSSDSYAIFHAIPERVITVAARPSWEDYSGLTRPELIAIENKSLFEGTDNTIARRFEVLAHQIDILFHYHQGTHDKTNLVIADQLLSERGHYVEFFIPPDGTDSRIVTYFSRTDVKDLLKQR